MINSETPKKEPPIWEKNINDQYKNLEPVDVPEFKYLYEKKSFWKRFKNSGIVKFFSRTATAKNLPGRILYSVLGIGGAVEYTGQTHSLINTLNTFNMDLSLFEIGLFLIITLLTFLATRGIVSGLLKEIITEVIEAAKVLKKAKSESSPGGQTITKGEQQELIKEADQILNLLWRRLIRSKIAKLFGIKLSDFDSK